MPQTLDVTCQTKEYYEQLYRKRADPWDYYSAAEQAKYNRMIEMAKRFQPSPLRVLDVGCSLGCLTEKLADYAPDVYAFDIAESAVQRTQERCDRLKSKTNFHVELGDAVHPNHPNAYFDVIFLGDVIGNLPNEQDQHLAIRNTLALLQPDGILILTDCMKCYRQKTYVAMVEAMGGQVMERIYHHDRYWIKFRSLVKQFGKPEQIRSLLGSIGVHRAFTRLGSLRGPAGSKHFGLVVKQTSSQSVEQAATHTPGADHLVDFVPS
jgi:2-polyprenyl-3-methyl-5-hydroxy-6-metoxy-1,4-benzoquinol methylase